MNPHAKYKYNSLEELKDELKRLDISLPISEDLSCLKEKIYCNSKIIPNRIALHPMEGCDGTLDGNPGELTMRRYERFARGGAGLIWVEACAVVPEGRANPRQLLINSQTKEELKQLHGCIMKTGESEYGKDNIPYTVLQLTHSGRYSKPYSYHAPIIAVNNPYLDTKLGDEYSIISDDELEQMEDKYVEAAEIANEIGFDAIDIKSCHRYLISELLSAHTREGKYGGGFTNRTRFLLNIVNKINRKLGEKIDITIRLNVYDALPYPYGWGVNTADYKKPDLSEPIELLRELYTKGVKIVNMTSGNPYYNPHIGRPYDLGPYIPDEHPLKGVFRMLDMARQIKREMPDMIIIGTGFSWLRELGAFIAAGGIKEGWFTLAGFGRQAFAYPDFPRDIIYNDGMVKEKSCIACSKCTEMMRFGGTTGCVIRDNQVYGPIYKECKVGKESFVNNTIAEHI